MCGVVEAIREASTRWAGYSEPIIPVPAVDAVDDWWFQTLGTAEVDGLVNVNVDADVAEGVAERLGLPVVDLADIDKSGRTRFTTHPANLQPTQPRFVGQSAVLAREDGDLWEKVAAGDLTADQVADCEGGPVRMWRPGTADLIGRAQLYETCWLDVGASHFVEHQPAMSALRMGPGYTSWPGGYGIIPLSEPRLTADCSKLLPTMGINYPPCTAFIQGCVICFCEEHAPDWARDVLAEESEQPRMGLPAPERAAAA